MVTTDREKLDAIRAVFTPEWLHGRVLPATLGSEEVARARAVCAILDEPDATPTTFPRNAVREVLIRHGMWGGEVALDALAALWPVPQTIDREKAREVLDTYTMVDDERIEFVLDALAACVVPAPAQTIDREKAREVLFTHGALIDAITLAFVNDLLDALAACVVPAPHQMIDRDVEASS